MTTEGNLDITAIANAVVQIGLPAVFTILLLKEGFKLIRQMSEEIQELKIGVYLMLEKVDALGEYQKKIKELRAELATRKEKGGV